MFSEAISSKNNLYFLTRRMMNYSKLLVLSAILVSNAFVQYVNGIVKRPCHPTFIRAIVKDALITSQADCIHN